MDVDDPLFSQSKNSFIMNHNEFMFYLDHESHYSSLLFKCNYSKQSYVSRKSFSCEFIGVHVMMFFKKADRVRNWVD